MNHSIEYRVVKRGIIYTVTFTLGLWLILFIEWIGKFDFDRFGIMPRTLSGLIGILTGPLIHAGIFHLLANTLPLIILGFGLMYFYYRIAIEVFVWIYLTSGFWVWVIGRTAFHIGASGVIYGLMSFLIVSGLIRRNIRSLAISMAVFFLYGGTIYGVLPSDPHISWESHLMGLLAGSVIALFFRKEPIFVGSVDEEEVHPEDGDQEERPYFSGMDNTAEENKHLSYDYKPRKKEDH